MSKRIRKLHRWLGLVFSVTILAAAGSGLLHNVMTMTQSAPPPAQPKDNRLDPQQIRITPPQAAAQAGLRAEDIEMISFRKIGGQICYQFLRSDKGLPVYVGAEKGDIDPVRDEQYASQIASAHLGGAAVKKTAYLQAFDAEYIAIFRILPVYRFDADDGKGTRVYVSTMTGSVTRQTDHWKQLEADIFSLVHKYSFIPDKTLRNILLSGTTLMAALVALLGIVLFFRVKA